MLSMDEVVAITGHPVGGVCPFGLATEMEIYCDISLKAYDEVVPAAGSTHSAVRINPAAHGRACQGRHGWMCASEQAHSPSALTSMASA